jgi:integrase
MNVNIYNGISVNITLLPKKNRTDNTKYNMCIMYTILKQGFKQDNTYTPTGITINIKDWKNGQIVARTELAKLQNERLNEYFSVAKDLCNQLAAKKIDTCKAVLAEIKANSRLMITGKAPKGQKQAILSRLQEYSYQAIVNRYISEKQPSKARLRNYQHTVNHLNEYYKGETPTIDQFSKQDLEGIKIFITKKFENKNTVSTYLGQIAAIFKYANNKDIISANPTPENFRGSFIDANRKVLTKSERLAILNLNDSTLSKTQQIAKYSFCVQMVTGMGYGELKAIQNQHIIFDKDEQAYFIEKKREKTGIQFRVCLSERALLCIEKLKEITGDESKPFKLPSIEYISRLYKELGILAGISTNITTYTPRHTFSVDLMENGGTLEDLRENLGHTNLKTTLIYGKISLNRSANKMKELQSKSLMHQLPQPLMKAV